MMHISRPRRGGLVRAMLCAASAVAVTIHATPAIAQGAAQQIEMQAQPLERALVEIGRRYGVSVIASAKLTRGKQAKRVSGKMTVEQALSRTLAGSGLTYNRSGSGRYVIVRAAAQLKGTESKSPDPLVKEVSEQAAPANTIIVTGTKQNQSIQDTQTSVTVITGEQAKENALFNLEDIVLRVPNISAAGASLNDISIRGISFGGVGNAGGGVTANIYVDGAPSSSIANFGALNLWDIAQVEVLRGPQSTVQGRNALGGAIIYQTADPEYEFGLDARVLIGNENSRQYSAAVTGPIIADQLAFRLSADYREVDFEVVNQRNGLPTRFQEGLTLRGKFLIEPQALSDLRLELIGEYNETETGDFNAVAAPVPISDPAFADFDPFGNESFATFTNFSKINSARFIADLDYQLSDNWSIKLLGTYEDAERDRNLGINQDFGQTETYSGELRTNFDYGNITGWIGGYFFETSSDGVTTIELPATALVGGLPVIPAESIVTGTLNTNTDTTNYAIFGDVTFGLDDRIKINLGARYDWEELENAGLTGATISNPPNCVVAPVVPVFGGTPCALLLPVSNEPPQNTSFEAFLPRVSIIYDLDDDRSVSFTAARGYRAGGVFTANAGAGEVFIGSFDPEFLNNYEFAFRSVWPDAGITFNANIFYSDWTDQQVSVPGRTGGVVDVITLNAGSSELYGAEFSVEVDLSDRLSLFGNLGLLWTEFTDFPFAVDNNGDPVNAVDPQFANLAGDRFNSAPRANAAFGLSYKDEQGFFANTNASYSSAQDTSIPNLPENRGDSAFLVNARLGYSFDNFEIAMFADNLFNDRVLFGRSLLNVPAGTGAVTEIAEPSFRVNEPRLWGVEARARF
ncbi:MAG: TonB-dependent receptor [Pseudomonadota bacterium]